MSKIHLVGRIKIMPGKLEQAKKIAADGVAGVKATQPGTLRFECYLNAAGDEFTYLETYKDVEAVKAHMAALGQGMAQLADVIQITSLEVFGDLPADLKKALKDMAPKYHKFVAGLGN